MQFTRKLKNRAEKKQFLEELVTGESSISELLLPRFRFYSPTNVPDIYYLWDSASEKMMHPKIENGQPILRTKQQIEEEGRIPPNVCRIVKFRPYDNGENYLKMLEEALKDYNLAMGL